MPALERGVIDATEFSMPTIAIALDFCQIAKNNYFPGWHQQTSVSELLMNRNQWNALSEQHKTMIEMPLGYSIVPTYAETEAKNFVAMEELQSKYGVTVHRWPDSTLKAMESACLKVVAELSTKDPLFQKVADSYFTFRKNYKRWGDAQYLKPTNQ